MEPPYVKMGSADEAQEYAARHGHWTVANVRQSIGWTQKPVTIEHAGEKFLLLPEDDGYFPAVAMLGELEASRRAILEFVSALSWSSSGSVAVEYWTGGSRLFRAGKRVIGGQVRAMTFKVSYLPAPNTADQKLALALFHEGSALIRTHAAYSFLSFYKIINMVSGRRGDEQERWINQHAPAMKHHRSKQRLEELLKRGEDIGRYLYQSCRCAIAHAGDPRNPVIDPHNPEDERRLRADLPVIITLAEIAIEELGVKTASTVYNEHRYELSGFEKHFPTEMLKVLKAGGTPADGQLELPAWFSLRMWGRGRYWPLEEMTPEQVRGQDGVVAIRCRSKEAGYFANVILDFPNDRLNAEVFGENVTDDGSADFVDAMMEIERFIAEWNLNGSLEVWAEGEVCVGRCDEFLPVNVIFDHIAYEAQITEFKAEIARRPRRGASKDASGV
jgi:hypothetical protein